MDKKIATAFVTLIGTGLACWLILSCCNGSKGGTAPSSAGGQSARWIRVVVPDDWRGLLEFKSDRAPTAAGAIEVTPDEHGIIHLPQPNPLEDWHSIEVRTISGVRVPVVDPTDPQSASASGVIAMITGAVRGNRVFLFVCDAEHRGDFEGAVRRAIGFSEEPGTVDPGSP